jgi:large subunit ribosomal protein L25
MEKIVLNAKIRNVFGKKLKSYRKKGLVPAVLYGHKVKPQPLFVNLSEFNSVFSQSGTSTLVDLKIEDGKAQKILIKEPQYHPLELKPLHVDFYQVKMKEKIQTEIPLKFVGESPAVKEMEGTLITPRDSIEIECLPADLIHEVIVDISKLKTFDDVIKVSDLNIPSTIEVLTDQDEVIASVTPPRSEEELAELEAPVEEKVEEVEEVEEAEKKEEEGEEKVGEETSPEKIPETGQETPGEKSEEK